MDCTILDLIKKVDKLNSDLQNVQVELYKYEHDSNARLACICEHLGIKLTDGYRVEKGK